MKDLETVKCKDCGVKLEPIYFREKESYLDSYGHYIETGRSRIAVDYLICPECLKKFIVDGDFGNGEWKYKGNNGNN